jgi:hypothetical protein
VEGWPVLDDTDFVPVLKREMAPADIEYELNVWFDVCPSLLSLLLLECGKKLISRHTMTEPTEVHSIMCTSQSFLTGSHADK